MYNPAYIARQRWHFPKEHERNFLAAFFHMATIALTCTSLAQLGWFRLRGSQCAPHLAVYQFFSFGYFDTTSTHDRNQFVGGEMQSSPVTIQYYSTSGKLPCVTPQIANLMRVLILLCFMAILCSLVGFFLDIIGPTRHMCKVVRRNAIPSILTVLLVVAIVGVCYHISVCLEVVLQSHSPEAGAQVSYEYGCYTITAAGCAALLATACNLLQQRLPAGEELPRQRLVDDWDGAESFVVRGTPMESIIPPPPPYTP